MSNSGNSKSLRIKLRDPVEGGKKTFGTVGMEREKLVVSGAEIGSAIEDARNFVQMKEKRGAAAVGLSRVVNLRGGARLEKAAEPLEAAELAARTAPEEVIYGVAGASGAGIGRRARASGSETEERARVEVDWGVVGASGAGISRRARGRPNGPSNISTN